MSENNFLLFEDDAESKKEENNEANAQGEDSQKLQQRKKKLTNKLKTSIFEVFSALLKSGVDIGPMKIYLLVFIEFIQFLQFSFHPLVILLMLSSS